MGNKHETPKPELMSKQPSKAKRVPCSEPCVLDLINIPTSPLVRNAKKMIKKKNWRYNFSSQINRNYDFYSSTPREEMENVLDYRYLGHLLYSNILPGGIEEFPHYPHLSK